MIGGARIPSIAIHVDLSWGVRGAESRKLHAALSVVNVFVVCNDLSGGGWDGVRMFKWIAVDVSMFEDGLQAFGFKFDDFAIRLVDVPLQGVGYAKAGLGVQVISIEVDAP